MKNTNIKFKKIIAFAFVLTCIFSVNIFGTNAVGENGQFASLRETAYYDEILRQFTPEENYENNFELIAKRALVERLGYSNLQKKKAENPQTVETFDWLLSDEDALELFIETGTFSKPNAVIDNLNVLYSTYKDILSDTENGYTYKKMLIALSVAYGNDIVVPPYRYASYLGQYSITDRFDTLKKYFDDGLFWNTEQFKNLTMEHLRTVVNDYILNSDTIKEADWLYNYTKEKRPNINNRVDPWNYMAYIKPNYSTADLYDEANAEKFNTKYGLDKYSIPVGTDNEVRTWMVMEKGGICWNMSRLGQTISKLNGIPVVGTYQPQHEAFFFYSENADGLGMWQIVNSAGSWANTYSSWGGFHIYRMPLNWGTNAYSKPTKNNGTYIMLSQGAFNRYADLKKSLYINLLADSYTDFDGKLSVYNTALEALDINLDSYVGLINLYKANKSVVTEKQWQKLGEQIIGSYTYYPQAMNDLIEAIKGQVNGKEKIALEIQKINALNKASVATSEQSLQNNFCQVVAKAILSTVNKTPFATFSFDGENKNKIMLSQTYSSFDVNYEYSLDGGNTWTQSGPSFNELTSDELASLNIDDDILLRVQGTEDTFIIDIKKETAPNASTLAISNEEDRFAGATSGIEYSFDQITWQKLDPEQRFPGNIRVYVRKYAHAEYMTSDTVYYTFTADTNPDSFRYIYIDRLTFVSAGLSQRPATNMLDANPLTSWHTKYNVVAEDKSFVLKFDKAINFAGFEYDPEGPNGRILEVEVYVSLDGENWQLAGQTTWARNANRKKLQLTQSVIARYVKIEAIRTDSNGVEAQNKYVSGKGFNFYEDLTKAYPCESGHTWQHEIGQNPTCTVPGYSVSKTCTVCGEVNSEREELPALGHSEKIIHGTPATCSENGVSDGKVCTVCGEILQKQEILPMKDHADSDGDGKCDVCGENLKSPEENCDHICHQGGFNGFIWKIVVIFLRIFGINKTCICGASHY